MENKQEELKSAEEILRKHIFDYNGNFKSFQFDVKLAMEEYADQFKKQLIEKEEQLTKSKEMAERLLKLIPSDEDIEKLGEKWLGGKFNYATYDAHLTGFIEGQKQLRSKFLTEYQNSKK